MSVRKLSPVIVQGGFKIGDKVFNPVSGDKGKIVWLGKFLLSQNNGLGDAMEDGMEIETEEGEIVKYISNKMERAVDPI